MQKLEQKKSVWPCCQGTPYPTWSPVRYRSKACQADYWKEHKTLCQAISTLADQNYWEDRERSQTFVSHLLPQKQAQVIRLVGQKCTVKCLLNGVETEALWDTGAQVSIIPSNWVRKFYPGTHVRNIAELLGMGGLDLKTANGTDLPYKVESSKDDFFLFPFFCLLTVYF